MRVSPTLSALALAGALAPMAHAVSIKDDVMSLGIGMRLQTRAELAQADNATGDDWNVAGGANGENDTLDFSVRRFYVTLDGKYGADWRFKGTIFTERVDTGQSNQNRGINIRYAWVERIFKHDEKWSSAVHVGLDKPYNVNEADYVSSSVMLLPYKRAAAEHFLRPRGVGVGYRLVGNILAAAVDVQNNTNAARDLTQSGGVGNENLDEGEGFAYSARVEFSISPDWFTTKRAESYAGAEGQHLVFGLSYGVNDGALVHGAAPAGDLMVTTTLLGADVLFHWDAITALISYHAQDVETELTGAGTAAETDIDGTIIAAQVGYAFKLDGGTVIEPAVRYQIIDLDTDNDDEAVVYGAASAENGRSGDQIDLGVNVYFSGHSNKLQLGYQMWNAEDGDGQANVLRLQHQLNF